MEFKWCSFQPGMYCETLPVRSVPSFKFVTNKFFKTCIALSTTLFPVCNRGVQYSISMFQFVQNSLYSFDIKAPPLSDLIFSGIPYKLKLFVSKFMTSFVRSVLQIFTVGHLLKRSTAIKIWTSPFICLLCSFPVKIHLYFCPVRLVYSTFRNDYLVFDILNFYRVQGRQCSF